MRYAISIEYTTGDSFGSERTTSEVGCSWTDLEKAKDALQRIKAHYTAYRDRRREYTGDDKFTENLRAQPWFYKADPSVWQHAVILEKDDGSEQMISPFWVGYFETLHVAEIIFDDPEDTDIKVYF